MATVTASIKRHPLVAFFVLSYALMWMWLPLASISLMLPLFIGTFGPALAAIIVTALTEGKAGLKALLRRVAVWRVGAQWYVAAVGLPVALGLAALGASLLLGASPQVAPLPLFNLIIVVFHVGEELGWRGYALPKMLATRSALSASVIVGALHAVWHLPLFLMPGMPLYGLSFAAYLPMVIAFGIVFTWLYNHTRGSVLIATLFHGAINNAGIFYAGLDPALNMWLRAAEYVLVALLIVILTGPNLMRKPMAQMQASRVEQLSISL